MHRRGRLAAILVALSALSATLGAPAAGAPHGDERPLSNGEIDHRSPAPARATSVRRERFRSWSTPGAGAISPMAPIFNSPTSPTRRSPARQLRPPAPGHLRRGSLDSGALRAPGGGPEPLLGRPRWDPGGDHAKNALLSSESIASGGPSADFRVVCDGAGEIRVDSFTSPGSSFQSIVGAARSAGFSLETRNYTIFYDGSGGCGIGSYANDERLTASNRSNQGGGYAVAYQGCWTEVPMHENGHNMGAVQYSAPN